MKTLVYFVAFIYFGLANIAAQDSLLVGRKYFEDQIYAGFTYNILNYKSIDLQQKGISTGFHLGFIKDFPLNKKGTFALGFGFGYSYNKYSQNLKIQNQTPEFVLISEDYEYDKNLFSTHAIEIPIELRVYRSSSPIITKFFRIYLGGKLSYIFHSKSKYTSQDESIIITPLPYVNNWQYGPYLAIGWGPWNLYTYYGLASLFTNAPQTETLDPNQLKSLEIGLQFYIF